MRYHSRRIPSTGSVARFAAGLSALLLGLAPSSANEVKGYEYVLRNAMPEPDELESEPATLRSSAQYVNQGPEHTLMWPSEDKGSLDRARFARGERRFGLFVPYWSEEQSASDTSGWTSYGRPVEYKTFDFQVTRGEEDREIAGQAARHYFIEAEIVSKTGSDPAYERMSLSSDVWVLEDKPFSVAPFATAGAYEDPRLTVALVERLSELGMVARVETRHTTQPQEDDGSTLGHAREGAHLAWISDLGSASVPDVEVAVASGALVDELRGALRENSDSACAAAMKGETPDFARELLDDQQQQAFLNYLEERCAQRNQG